MERTQRWQDWVMLVFGVWLFFSPFILRYHSYNNVVAWNAYVFGAGVAIFAIIALASPHRWEARVNLVLGIWLVISPFALGFDSELAPTWNNVLLGLLIGRDAVWAMLRQSPPHPAAQ